MVISVPGISVRRLGAADADTAIATLKLMAEVFDEEHETLSAPYVRDLLRRPDFWLIAAFSEERPVGGITAHTLPLTRLEAGELFIYDLAVHGDFLRRGIGRVLVQELLEQGARENLHVAWVPADEEDEHALEFYRSLGADEAPVKIFTFDSTP